MVVSTTRTSSKGQVVIPKRLREELGLKPGDPLAVAVEGNALVLCKITLRDLVDASLRRYKKGGALSHAEVFADLL
jgi:AbrB family looped-hinge helix DNA binding protein